MKNDWTESQLFKKAWEIEEITEHIITVLEKTDTEYVDEYQKELVEDFLFFLRKNSKIIPVNIKYIIKENVPYDIKMEHAAMIKRSAINLLDNLQGIENNGYKDKEYLDLLRKEVDEFRVLFAKQVKTFDPWNYKIDRWGLFNPPGVNYDDEGPDDDLPFDFDPFDEDDDY